MTSHHLNMKPQDLLNRSECLEVIRKSFNFESSDEFDLRFYSITRGSDSLVGFMGEYYILNVLFKDKDGEKQMRYFVKTVPISNQYHRNECERKGFFEKESRIYTEILANLAQYVPVQIFPKCFYSRKDIIVLEDISDKYSHLSDDDTYTMEHHKIVLRNQARLHAASIAWEIDENFNMGEKFEDVFLEMQLNMNNEWFVAGAKGIVFLAKRHPKYQSKEDQKFMNEKLFKLLCDAKEFTDPSKELRNVLCHRDNWNRNILFKFNKRHQPLDCQFVDFQLTRYSPPGIDVLFFLYVTTTPERRAEIFNEFLDFYYEALNQAMTDLDLMDEMISKEDFLKGVERARLPILIVFAICEPLMKMPKGLSNKMRAEESEKFDFYMNNERDEMFLRIMEMDPDYETIIMRPIEELLDTIFKMENEKKMKLIQ